MEEISPEKSYEFFIDTLGYLHEEHLNSDSDLEYFILEELEGDAVSFLHSWTVDRLIEAQLIPETIKSEVHYLRELLVTGIHAAKWNLQSIKTDFQWIEARRRAKVIVEAIASFQK